MPAWLHALIAWKGALVAVWLAAFLAAEQAWPRARSIFGVLWHWPRALRNGGLWLVTAGASFFVVLPVTVWAAGYGLWARPGWWSGWPGLLLDLALLDLWIYWWHRANHTVPFLWRFHEIHHRDRFLDASSALRFHFGEVLLSAAVRAVVIVALALPLASVLIFEMLVLVAAIFHHSNLRLPPGFERSLSRILVTPSIHWVHHHRIQADTDSNYATALSLWDRLFGSQSVTARTPDMPIGVEGREEASLPRLLALPFLPRRP